MVQGSWTKEKYSNTSLYTGVETKLQNVAPVLFQRELKKTQHNINRARDINIIYIFVQ